MGNPGDLGDAVGSWRDRELYVPTVTGWNNSCLLKKIERDGIGQSMLLEIKDIQL